MRRIWSSPELTYEWGEPRFDQEGIPLLWCTINARIGETAVHSSSSIPPWARTDIEMFQKFSSYLIDAKAEALSAGLARWDEYLAQPQVREAENMVVNSRSFKEHPIFLDKTWDEGRPHDYALYRDYIWSLDPDLQFDDTWSQLDERLCQEWQRLTNRVEAERESAIPREKISEAVRHEVWRRDGGQCAHCGSRERLEFDHIIPLSLGGGNTVRNLELLCENCNRKKGASLSC